ncbi:MAG: hypothetical protein Q8L88_02490 [Bacteroidota bacterium]|nr:hypothetical protein [Bacteroidota bacterium]
MKEYLKYASYIVVCVTIAYVCLTLRNCGTVGESSDRTDTPADSAYLPIIVRSYTPKSTPFEKPVKPVSKLPKGVKEKDVKRVITISGKKLLQIIETKNGYVLVSKNGDSLEVAVTNYFDPIFEFGLFAGVGINLNAAAAAPSVSISFVKVCGNFLAPVVAADLRSIGIGIGYKFYHDITVTPLLMWNYSDTQRTIKLNLSYQL